MKKELFFLSVIIFIGVFLRFWRLSDVPPSLSHDEVAIGYNSYSILQTGKDEYGSYFPFLFRSFDDYKLPGMVYATIPFVAIFGLNEVGIRFPSAFFGSLAIIVFYFLIKKLYWNEKVLFALFSTFFFSISIWHINFSRQLFESNGALFFLLCGVYFLLTFPEKPKQLIFAAFFLAISVYFYYSVRLALPFILIAFLFIHRKVLKQHVRLLLISFLVGLFILLPFFPSLFSSGGISRISMVSVVNDSSYLALQEDFAKKSLTTSSPLMKLFYNRRVALLITAGQNYLKNISFQHIFFSGTGSLGLLYVFEMPFFFFGIYCLFKRKEKEKWLIIAWLLSVPLVGAVTTNQPNSLRALLNAPVFALLSGLGFTSFFLLIKKIEVKIVFLTTSFITFLFFFIQFVKIYFYETPRTNSLHFGDGYKQMVSYIENNEGKYDRIYISGYYWRPYIFSLFWSKYNPQLYQEKGTRDEFGKYFFGAASWDASGVFFGDPEIHLEDFTKDNKDKVLFILAPQEYKVQKNNLIKVGAINGKYANEVFIVAILR